MPKFHVFIYLVTNFNRPQNLYFTNLLHGLTLTQVFLSLCFFHAAKRAHQRADKKGHGTDYLNLALRDGGVSLTMGLSNGKQEMHIKPSRVRFDDHQWHKVTVHRRIQEVSWTRGQGFRGCLLTGPGQAVSV